MNKNIENKLEIIFKFIFENIMEIATMFGIIVFLLIPIIKYLL